MLIQPLLLPLFLATSPALAQDVGARTRSPQSMVADLRLAPGDDDLREALAAAAAFPLGARENPVRVGGPAGETAYLARLRCADGSAPRIGARAEGGVGGLGTIVHAFTLDCGRAAPDQASVFMDMYHAEHREERAPPGFTILPG